MAILGVRVPNTDLVGDLWALAKEEDGFTFRWNVDSEAPRHGGIDIVLPLR
jgi:hypothetical protein